MTDERPRASGDREIEPEPPSLLDDPTAPELARLLSFARSDPGLDGPALERVVARAAKPPAPLGGGGALALGGVALVVALVSSALVWRALAPDPADSAAPVADPPERVRPPASEPRAEEPSLAPLPEALRPEPSPEPPASRRSPSRGPARASSEGSLLLRARSALRGDPARALEITDEHRRLYPEGAMAEEREALAIEALAALDRGEALRARADRFGRSYPRSPYAARVRAALARAHGNSTAP